MGRKRPGFARALAPAPDRLALLRERTHALAEVLGAEARLAQLDQLALELLGEPRVAQRPQDTLVAGERERRVAGDLARDLEHALLEALGLYHLVHEPPLLRPLSRHGVA